METLH